MHSFIHSLIYSLVVKLCDLVITDMLADLISIAGRMLL